MNLINYIPEGVNFESAAFFGGVTIAAIAAFKLANYTSDRARWSLGNRRVGSYKRYSASEALKRKNRDRLERISTYKSSVNADLIANVLLALALIVVVAL